MPWAIAILSPTGYIKPLFTSCSLFRLHFFKFLLRAKPWGVVILSPTGCIKPIFSQLYLRNRIPLHFMACAVASCPINPLIIVFPHQTIASHRKSLKKSIFFHGLKGILRATRNVIASRPIRRRNHLLMKSYGFNSPTSE